MSGRSKATHAPLARLVSKLGLASRTQAQALARAGRITVNGAIVRDPEWWAPRCAVLAIDGSDHGAAIPRMLIMNKKRGLITARTDDKGRPVVCDHPLLQGTGCMPVGRLDKASEGLLLFTNDTHLAHQLTNPESHLSKTYFVRTNRGLTSDERLALGNLVVNLEGEVQKASAWTSMEEERNPSWTRVVLHEGKNRQIRRMLLSLGVSVQRLIRVSIGSLHLEDIGRGEVREVCSSKVRELRALVSSGAGCVVDSQTHTSG